MVCTLTATGCDDADSEPTGGGGSTPSSSATGTATNGGSTQIATNASSTAAQGSTSSGASHDGLLDCAESPAVCDAGGCHLMLTECEMADSPVVITEAPVTIRTPALSGADPNCEIACQETAYAFNVILSPADPSLASKDLIVRAPPPWSVALAHEGYALVVCDDPVPGQIACYFPADKPPTSCITTYGALAASIAISTTDPTAPSVDIQVEVADPRGCEE